MNSLMKLLILACLFMYQGCALLPYIQEVLESDEFSDPPTNGTIITNVVENIGPTPAWNEATKASCWSGSNAQKRNMNILSPHMSDDIFKERVKWQKDRDVTPFICFLSNKADGEYAGYSIYGNNWDWTIDESFVKLFKSRIYYCRTQKVSGCCLVVC